MFFSLIKSLVKYHATILYWVRNGGEIGIALLRRKNDDIIISKLNFWLIINAITLIKKENKKTIITELIYAIVTNDRLSELNSL